MMEHLGGPESPTKIRERQSRYERPDSKQFKIVERASGAAAGWVGYWERDEHGEAVYETGWFVLPAFQRRGLAADATAQLISRAAAERDRRFLHAYPAVTNQPSNALCRRLGFELVDTREFEYPPGRIMRCHDWRIDLLARS